MLQLCNMTCIYNQINFNSCFHIFYIIASYCVDYISNMNMGRQSHHFHQPNSSIHSVTGKLHAADNRSISINQTAVSTQSPVNYMQQTIAPFPSTKKQYPLSHRSITLELFQPRHEKTCLWGLRPGKSKTGLRSQRS